ncbi:Uncharacterised protein [Mycobacteroides abscessus subsp. abscessus]|nr:Uncharacterised protein [Mycobacteroides abscessus subsp. abscessus]
MILTLSAVTRRVLPSVLWMTFFVTISEADPCMSVLS